MFLRVGMQLRSFSSGSTNRALLLGLGGGDSMVVAKMKVDLGGGLTKEKVLAVLQQQEKSQKRKESQFLESAYMIHDCG